LGIQKPPLSGYYPIAVKYPTMLFVEPVRKCNLRCRMCPIEVFTRPDIITMDRYRHIIEEFHFIRRIELVGLGEPMLHPHLCEMIKLAAEKGIAAHFITNGSLLNYENCVKLIKAGLSALSISFDAPTAATYEYIRVGASFDNLLRNLHSLKEAKSKMNSKTPEITFRPLRLKCNLDELPDLVNIAKQMGAKDIVVSDIAITSDPKVDESFQKSQQISSVPRHEATVKLEALRERAKRLGVKLHMQDYPEKESTADTSNKKHPFVCDLAWSAPYVTVNGFITPCCYASDPNIWNMGNIFETSFESIWNNKKFRSVRKTLLDGGSPLAICATCPARNKDPRRE